MITGINATQWVVNLLDVPLKIVLVLVVAAILIGVVRWLISRLAKSIIAGASSLRTRTDTLIRSEPTVQSQTVRARREKRANTISVLLKSVSTLVVSIIALLIILDLLGINIGPILASAGIVGIAIGFGAQELVKDFISGIFMLIEDQYGVGDVIKVNADVSGTVEDVTLRVTQIRDVNGVLWYVRNGQISQVGNMTQGFSNARVQVRIAATAEIAPAIEKLNAVAQAVSEDDAVAGLLFDQPSVVTYDDLTADSAVFYLQAKTLPGKQWDVARIMRRHLQAAASDGTLKVVMPPILPPS